MRREDHANGDSLAVSDCELGRDLDGVAECVPVIEYCSFAALSFVRGNYVCLDLYAARDATLLIEREQIITC